MTIQKMLCGLALLLLIPRHIRADEHLVPSTELARMLSSASTVRQTNVAKIDRLFSAERVRQSLASVRIDAEKVKSVATLLSDQEVAELAARADKIDRDVSGGALTNQELTYIVIALATAVIVLIIVKH